jgi:ATPase subunit of ABC transporter with duplicated ATPase domains
MIQSISVQSLLGATHARTGDERRKSLLGVKGLRKHHGERLLFDIGCMEIATHSAYVLTGINGAGKSTLLRILGGLERADIDSLRFRRSRGAPLSLSAPAARSDRLRAPAPGHVFDQHRAQHRLRPAGARRSEA